MSVTLLLMFWPLVVAISPMMLGAPDAINKKDAIIAVMVFLHYPIGLLFLVGLLGFDYFGVNSFKLSAISCVIIALPYYGGHYRLLLNILNGIANAGYSVARGKAFYDGKQIENSDGHSFEILEGGNHRSFENEYAKDKSHAYYRGEVVEGIISHDIHKLTMHSDRYGYDTYWHNNKQVIYSGEVLTDANPDNFSDFEGFREWAYSINNEQYIVYHSGTRLPAVDKLTFIPLNSFIAKDKNKILEKDKQILAEADAASFELLDDHDFGRDNKHVYYLATKQPFAINNADPVSFVSLNRGYFKDRNNVYYVHQYESVELLEQVDVTSFQVTGYDDESKSEARDKNHLYLNGKVVGGLKK
ncbi:hypothetical protein MNBD_GAMMA10-3234 [hydrothermal vent metagenome]|uniref:DKNYY family protein n=1 Tax=hydrothermal vent metagenome TaxID=652676 RepID=A0A3B0YPA0_9ZZZZ